MPTGGTISLTTVFDDLGVSSGNTQSTNQYDFYYGVGWTDASTTYTQYDFFKKTSEASRYDWMKQWGSEKDYYNNIDDANIDDFKTYYQYASAYFGAAPAVSCSGNLISTANLDIYYKMDGDATDSSGNGYDATATGTPTYIPVKFDDGISLNGSTQYLSESSYSISGYTAWSLSAWINIDTLPASSYSIAVKYMNTPPYGGFNLYLNANGTLGLLLSNWGAGSTPQANYTTTTATMSAGQNYHVAATWDQSETFPRIYIDGVIAATGSAQDRSIANITFPLWIGKSYVADPQYFWNGEIDDLSIWNRSLTPAEVTSLAAGTCPLNTDPMSGGLINTYTEGGLTYSSHTFLSSDNLVVDEETTVDVLLVAGGGGGAQVHTGGGGAGGSFTASFTLPAGTYPIVVGYGGSNSVPSTNGGTSSFNATYSSGGGNGPGGDGGSGGGGHTTNPPGTGIVGQGNDGASGVLWKSGGGGGKGAAGSAGTAGGGGAGGVGWSNTYRDGTSIFYAGGGGGGTDGAAAGGAGGNGGGGAGGNSAAPGVDGTANTGGGGGGGGVGAGVVGGAGGSGIVIIRYRVN